jgi:hypothetical protein
VPTAYHYVPSWLPTFQFPRHSTPGAQPNRPRPFLLRHRPYSPQRPPPTLKAVAYYYVYPPHSPFLRSMSTAICSILYHPKLVWRTSLLPVSSSFPDSRKDSTYLFKFQPMEASLKLPPARPYASSRDGTTAITVSTFLCAPPTPSPHLTTSTEEWSIVSGEQRASSPR